MKNRGIKSITTSPGLRLTAEEIFEKKHSALFSMNKQRLLECQSPLDSEIQRLIFELEVHQLELELQNKELHRANKQMKDLADRYVGFFDFSESAYFILSANGNITDLNLAGSKMLRRDRLGLNKINLGSFIADESKLVFNLFLESLKDNYAGNSCDILLEPSDGKSTLNLRLAGFFNEQSQQYELIAKDVSHNKGIESPMTQELEKLREENDLFRRKIERINPKFHNPEQSVKFDESIYPFMIEHAGIGIGVFSVDGIVQLLNKQAIQNLGGKSEDYIGKSLIEIFGAQKGSIYMDRIKQSLISTTSLNFEDQIPMSGGFSWFYSVFTRIENSTGQIIGIKVNSIDITKLKNTETKLIESEERYHELFEMESDAILVIDENTGNILESNLAASHLYGYSSEEFQSLSDKDLVVSQEVLKNNLDKLLGMAPNQIVKNFRAQHIRKDGTIFPVEITGRIFTKKGKEVRIAAIRDVTEREKAEESIMKSEMRFRTMFEDAPLGIAIIDSVNGNIYEFNSTFAKITGRTLEEMTKNNLISIIHPDDIQETIDQMALLVENDVGGCKMEKRVIRPDRSIVWINMTVSHLIKEEGMPICHMIMIEEITERKQLEINLVASESKFHALFETLPAGVTLADEYGQIIESNPAAERILGLSQAEQLQRTIDGVEWMIIRPDGTPMPEDEFASVRALKEQTPINNVIMGVNKGLHDLAWLTVNAAPVEGFGVAISYEDITEQKNAEAKLKESEGQLRLLFDQMTSGFLVCKLIYDESGIPVDHQFIQGNPAFEQLTGVSFDELKVKTGHDFTFGWPTELIHEFYNVAQTGKPIHYQRFNKLLGRHFDVTVYAPCTGQFALLFNDIQEQKQAEDALKKSEKELLLLAEAMPQIVWITRPDGWNIYFNQQWVDYTGQSLEESYGHGWNKPFHPEDRQRAWDAWQNAIKYGAEYSLECRLRRADGIYMWWLVRGVPAFDTKGEIIKWFGTCTDIDKLKQTEMALIIAKEKAEEGDKLKSAFLANMSHEIRTPMNGIMGFAELLKDPKLSGEEQQEYISIIEKSGARMLNIINDIIDISKIESGQMKVYITETNINEQVEFIKIFFKPEAEAKGIELISRNILFSEEVFVKTDREKVFAILTNLVKNAIKYSDKGTIEIGYVKKGAFIEFFVKDQGIGIPKERQEAIFERFIQADIGDKRAYQGAGLGLTISKAYVEMLGGRIWVESENGKGSIFHFTLPVYPEQIVFEDLQNITPAFKEESLKKKLKVLIVEDDDTSQKLVAILVKSISKSVLKERTGIGAVEACKNNPDIDLVLMDIQMPELNGYEATRQIRRFNNTVIIIAQTAFGLSGDREKAIEAGCNDYLTKPIRTATLMELIKKYFNH